MEKALFVDCSLFTLGAECSLMVRGSLAFTKKLPMDSAQIGAMAKSYKAKEIYIKGAKAFTAKLSSDLMSDFQEMKIICIE